jgi:stalled ribosome rescue protein Dom34
MHGRHCVLWIDHEKARLVFFDNVESVSSEVISSKSHGHGNTHHKAGSVGAGKSALDRDFSQKIESELGRCAEFVVVGPGTAKLEFIRHVHRNAPHLDAKLVGVETMDHPTDPQLVDFARSYFRKFDRMHATNDEALAGMAAHRQ